MLGAQGLRVLEVGESLSGAYCGLVLSGQGAEVAQVRHGLNRRLDEFESAYYDRGRIVLDEPAELRALASTADILLTDLVPAKLRALGLPIDEDELQQWRPGLIHVAISPFGLNGPHADYASDDITEWAAGGLAYVTRRPIDASSPDFSPVLAPARQPELLAGMAAVIAAFASVRMARTSGRAVLADVSRQEVQVAMAHQHFPGVVWSNLVYGGPKLPVTGIGFLVPSADGMIYFRAVDEHQWLALADWMGIPSDVASERIDGVLMHHRDPDAVRELLIGFASDFPSQFLFEEGQRRRIPVALPNELPAVLDSAQLADRGAWVHGIVYDRSFTAPSIPLLEPEQRKPNEALTATQLQARWENR